MPAADEHDPLTRSGARAITSHVWTGPAGIVLAYVGQALLARGSHTFHAGWVTLLLGALLFAAFWWHREAACDVVAVGPPAEPDRQEPTTVRWASALIAGALGVSLMNAADWWVETPRTRWMWITSMVLLLAGCVSARRRTAFHTIRPDEVPRGAALIGLAVVIATALVLRGLWLGTLPLDVHGDFASMGLGARELLAGNVPALFATGWAGLPWPSFLPGALSMAVVGDDLAGLRTAGVIAGVVSVAGTYLLTTEVFDRRVGLAAAAIAAVGHVDIHFSRVGTYIDPVPWLVFGFWLLVRGLRLHQERDLALSGVLLAVACQMYFSGRLAVPLLALFVAYLALRYRADLHGLRRGWLSFAIAMVVTTGPMMLYNFAHSDAFLSRSREVWFLSPDNLQHLQRKYEVSTPLAVLGEQLWRSLLTFNYTPDSSTQFGYEGPFLHRLIAPLLVLGTAFAVVRIGRWGPVLFVLWLGAGLLLGSALTIDAPFWPRLIVLTPAVAALAGLGLVLSIDAVAALFRRRLPAAISVIVATLLIGTAGYQNARDYFTGLPATRIQPIAVVARTIGDAPQSEAFCMVRGSLALADRVPAFVGKDHDMQDILLEAFAVQAPRCVEEGRTWIVFLPEQDHVLAVLKQRWPAGRERILDDFAASGVRLWYPPGR